MLEAVCCLPSFRGHSRLDFPGLKRKESKDYSRWQLHVKQVARGLSREVEQRVQSRRGTGRRRPGSGSEPGWQVSSSACVLPQLSIIIITITMMMMMMMMICISVCPEPQRGVRRTLWWVLRGAQRLRRRGGDGCVPAQGTGRVLPGRCSPSPGGGMALQGAVSAYRLLRLVVNPAEDSFKERFKREW